MSVSYQYGLYLYSLGTDRVANRRTAFTTIALMGHCGLNLYSPGTIIELHSEEFGLMQLIGVLFQQGDSSNQNIQALKLYIRCSKEIITKI